MINDLIRQLQHVDPNVRKRAIIALGKSKDPAALKPLSTVVRGDPDPELRELARKAGQYIRQQAQQAEQAQKAQEAQQKPPEVQRPSVSPFTLPSRDDDDENEDDDGSYTPSYSVPDDDDDLPLPTTGALLGARPSPRADLDDDLPTTGALLGARTPAAQDKRSKPSRRQPSDDVDDVIEPLRAPPLYYEKEAPVKKEEPTPLVKGSSLVKGRKYNVAKADEERAYGYVNAALSNNLEGDNAKAMKNLTQAISMNPNLINDSFFSNVATSVTGLEGDAAVQMIIDRNQRKRFTEDASVKQKDKRVEKHLTEAKQSSWADVAFGVVFYALIVTFGPIFAVLVESAMIKNLLGSFAANSKQLPVQLQTAQVALGNVAAISPLPIGIVAGVTGVLGFFLQMGIIHFLAKMLGGVATWQHLVNVMLGFYNKWYLILYIVLALTIAFAFLSLFSPIMLCFLIVFVVLLLFIFVQSASKIGLVYDFGAAKGFVTLLLSGIVILLLNAAVGYLLGQSFSAALS